MQKALSIIIAAAIIYSIVQMKMLSPPEDKVPKVQTTNDAENKKILLLLLNKQIYH